MSLRNVSQYVERLKNMPQVIINDCDTSLMIFYYKGISYKLRFIV